MSHYVWKACRARGVLGVLALCLVAGCVTAYQPRSVTGGYQERQLSPSRWYVEFFGNGHTTRDTVMVYWLNRCAELTVGKGYDYFILVSKDPRPTASLGDSIVQVRGGGGAPTVVYVPGGGGGTVRTWSAHATIEMRKGTPDPDEPRTFVAKALMTKLAPLIQQAAASGKNVALPEDVLARAESDAPAQPPAANAPVKLEDLQGLLPKE